MDWNGNGFATNQSITQLEQRQNLPGTPNVAIPFHIIHISSACGREKPVQTVQTHGHK